MLLLIERVTVISSALAAVLVTLALKLKVSLSQIMDTAEVQTSIPDTASQNDWQDLIAVNYGRRSWTLIY